MSSTNVMQGAPSSLSSPPLLGGAVDIPRNLRWLGTTPRSLVSGDHTTPFIFRVVGRVATWPAKDNTLRMEHYFLPLVACDDAQEFRTFIDMCATLGNIENIAFDGSSLKHGVVYVDPEGRLTIMLGLPGLTSLMGMEIPPYIISDPQRKLGERGQILQLSEDVKVEVSFTLYSVVNIGHIVEWTTRQCILIPGETPPGPASRSDVTL
ncbi:hypothetical protein BDN72DRAFT_863168 [Pluteus cervinus]|uniref:Uncharacterized protein n=1 Tax=Pluteus cervinus TaxID=181527 RepID=A0ACD3A8J3_9AGAR|nr:hypothetical protein BDN72DRAFT_863168 [Pluteus cervinus]